MQQEVQQEVEEPQKKDERELARGYTLPEVYQMALKGKKFRRIGWKQKELRGAYITVKRGETKISFCKGKDCVPYQPSQEDAITPDWVEVSGE